MPQFQHSGATIHYETGGEGAPLLLIAGTASDSASWGPLLPLLPGRQLIMPDNHGSGRTECEGPLSLAAIVDDHAALLNHLGLDCVDVVGHSLGGYLGLCLAARHPARVRRLVTMGTGAVDSKTRTLFHDLSRLYFTTPPEDWFRLLYQWLFSSAFFEDEANVAAAAAASASYPWRQSPSDFARQVAAIDAAGPVDLSTITVPILALSAEADLLAPPATVEATHRRLRTLRDHLSLPAAAHSIHWEAPQAVADAINGFLA